MMFLNGKHHTHFAGAWTILSSSPRACSPPTNPSLTATAFPDMHEIAIVSGFAAAYRLGARYPFTDDKDCKRLFALYLAASHGSRMVSSSHRLLHCVLSLTLPPRSLLSTLLRSVLQRSADRDGFFR